MKKSYNFTGALSLGGFKEVQEVPRKRLSVFDLRRLLAFLNWAWFLGVCALLYVIHLSFQSVERKEVQRQEISKNSAELQAQIVALNARIKELKDLNVRTVSSTLEVSRKIQRILETSRGEERAFLLTIVPEALRIQATHGIPASATVAMAAYESNYGRSELAQQHHNFFGIKALDPRWDGPKALMPTRDLGVATSAYFRCYDSAANSVQGYAEFLSGSGKYSRAFDQKQGELFVGAVLQGGYCPDKTYLESIRGIIKRHQLSDLDLMADSIPAEQKVQVESESIKLGMR